MKRIWIIILLLSETIHVQAQDTWNSISIGNFSVDQLDLISFDTKDQLYLSNAKGDIFLFGRDAKQKNLFSPARQGKLSQLEAAWTVTIFTFSYDLQEYRLLDRFLNPISEKGFFIPEVNLVKAATLGNNNILWIWDESDLSLKRLDLRRNLVLDSQPLNLLLETGNISVSEIREFKNRLFMNIPNSGVYIFDNQGNLIKKLDIPLVKRLTFYKEHLLWIEANQIWAISLSSGEQKVLLRTPFEDVDQFQVGQEIVALVKGNQINLYPIPSQLKKLN